MCSICIPCIIILKTVSFGVVSSLLAIVTVAEWGEPHIFWRGHLDSLFSSERKYSAFELAGDATSALWSHKQYYSNSLALYSQHRNKQWWLLITMGKYSQLPEFPRSNLRPSSCMLMSVLIQPKVVITWDHDVRFIVIFFCCCELVTNSTYLFV